MQNKLSHFVETHYQQCTLKQATGIDCPGCGMQRSVHALLEGDLLQSVHYYSALIPLIGMFIYLGLHLLFKFQNGAKALTLMFAANALMILMNFITKIIPLLT